MKAMVAALALLVLIAVDSRPAPAGDWQVRATTRGVCSLQPSDSVPLLGKPLSRNPTKKEACEAARSIKADGSGKPAPCVDYTPNTVKLCRSEGVDLGK